MIIETKEKKNYWNSKPLWCQPWSIILTGLLFVSMIYLFFNSYLLTAIVAILVLSWWYLFLILAPKLYSREISNNTNI